MRLGRDDGAAAVEFALVLPLLILILGGAIEMGYLITVRAQIGEAVEEGVLVAAQDPDQASMVPGIVSDGVSILQDPPLPEDEVSVRCDDPDDPDVVTVSVVHEHDWVSPFLFSASITLDVEATSDVLSDQPCVEAP